ncbi:hypothetical protein Vadar_003502 [Vaccinium darrowii]|uniref:Uncharacterized protein n=1 Tax=Vaccinium darrowii TaxID=229202 RepID=A0ACB7YJ14_9ERIC|nr:hypothetical protein Vadar_003502 [Vaccinium darrowii]
MNKREKGAGNEIFEGLIEKNFIESIYQNCSLVPDSCRMSLYVCSSLYKQAEDSGFTSNDTFDLDIAFVRGGQPGHSCLINVGEAIINFKQFEPMKCIQSLHLRRWQSSAMHHIEQAEAKILHGLKKLYGLTFLSLQGISMITELPVVILTLNRLKILDLRACHNLEEIPDDIGLVWSLTHLDMSECYFLEHMPKSLAQLSNLEVLKGFLIGDFNNKKSCTLYDLSRLEKLRKFNIYVSVKDIHKLLDFGDLEYFVGLQKLTISWGGCRQSQEVASMELLRRGPLTLPPRLQKLDLQGFPIGTLTNCLRLTSIKGLEKLYIRGGQLRDLGQVQKHQGNRWIVKILRLKYLIDLEIDWSELRILFPELIYLHQVECPSLLNFPCDERGVWINQEAIDTHGQLQKYDRRVRTRRAR